MEHCLRTRRGPRRVVGVVGVVAAMALVASIPACGFEHEDELDTCIVALVGTDLRAPDEIDELWFKLEYRQAVQWEAVYNLDPNRPYARRLPVATYPMCTTRDPRIPITITMGGLLGKDVAVKRVARVSFIPDRTLVIRMDLLQECRDRQEPCPEGQTCTALGCRDIDIDPAELIDLGECGAACTGSCGSTLVESESGICEELAPAP